MRLPDASRLPGLQSKFQQLEKAQRRQVLTATVEGQTVFTITNGSYVVGSETLRVTVGGVPQPPDAYTETNSTTVTLSEGVPVGKKVILEWLEGKLPVVFGHNTSHYSDGQDPIDVTQLKNYKAEVADKIGILQTNIADIATINVKTYGVVGDGLTDDTAAIQSAFTAANGKRLEIPSEFNCLIKGQVTMPSDIIISCKGQITCTGDTDFWFYSVNPNRIVFEQFKATVTLPFASRLKYNRVIRCDNPTYFEVKSAEIIGSSTAIHSLNGEDFVCGDIKLKNVYGTAAQYGYGVNTSAKRTSIRTLNVVNDDTTHGRHALYINGSQWENIDVGYIYVKNFNKNPINIANTDTNAKCNFHLGTAVFINTNMEPTVDSTGCINGTDENGPGVRIVVDNIRVNGIGGCAVSSNGINLGQDGFYVGNIYAENLAPAYYANTSLVYLRYGNNKQVGKVVCTGLNTNWLCAVYLRDTNNAIVDDVYVGGTVGSQAIRLVSSTVTVGDVRTDSIQKIFTSSATPKYKYLTTGTRTASSSGSSNTLTITHGLGIVPSFWQVQKAISGLPAIDFVTADATYLNVTFVSNTPAGTNNIILNWMAKV